MTPMPPQHTPRIRAIAGYCISRDAARRLVAYWALIIPLVVLTYVLTSSP